MTTVPHIPNCFYRVSLKAIITNEHGKTLLVQEPDGRWGLPGGGLDHGEDITTGLTREIHEELGVAVTTIEHRPLFVWEQARIPQNDKHYFFIGFAVQVDNFNFKVTKEAVSAQFFTPDEMKSLNLHPNIKKLPQLLTKNSS